MPLIKTINVELAWDKKLEAFANVSLQTMKFKYWATTHKDIIKYVSDTDRNNNLCWFK